MLKSGRVKPELKLCVHGRGLLTSGLFYRVIWLRFFLGKPPITGIFKPLLLGFLEFQEKKGPMFYVEVLRLLATDLGAEWT